MYMLNVVGKIHSQFKPASKLFESEIFLRMDFTNNILEYLNVFSVLNVYAFTANPDFGKINTNMHHLQEQIKNAATKKFHIIYEIRSHTAKQLEQCNNTKYKQESLIKDHKMPTRDLKVNTTSFNRLRCHLIEKIILFKS